MSITNIEDKVQPQEETVYTSTQVNPPVIFFLILHVKCFKTSLPVGYKIIYTRYLLWTYVHRTFLVLSQKFLATNQPHIYSQFEL